MTIPAPKDFRDPNIQFTALYTKANEGGWPTGHVQVFFNPVEGEGEPRVVYEYERHYSMMRTFHAFRRWDGNTWQYYAFISPGYTTFQVLYLGDDEVGHTPHVVAERPYPQQPWYRTEKYDQYEVYKRDHPEYFLPGGYYAGKGPDDLINGEGFCPVDFYVPDLYEMFETAEEFNHYASSEDAHKRQTAEEFVNTPAWYSGCVWGDDSSMKLRTIDLSKLADGEVTDAEPYGYFEVASQLGKAIHFEGDFLRIDAELSVSLRDGSVYDPGINWRKEDKS